MPSKGAALGRAFPRLRPWRPRGVGLLLQDRTDRSAQFNAKVFFSGCRRRVAQVGRRCERAEALPIRSELGDEDAGKVVGQLVPFVRAKERFAGPKLLNLRRPPKPAVARMQLPWVGRCL